MEEKSNHCAEGKESVSKLPNKLRLVDWGDQKVWVSCEDALVAMAQLGVDTSTSPPNALDPASKKEIRVLEHTFGSSLISADNVHDGMQHQLMDQTLRLGDAERLVELEAIVRWNSTSFSARKKIFFAKLFRDGKELACLDLFGAVPNTSVKIGDPEAANSSFSDAKGNLGAFSDARPGDQISVWYIGHDGTVDCLTSVKLNATFISSAVTENAKVEAVEWACSACTFVNPMQKTQCSVCETQKTSDAVEFCAAAEEESSASLSTEVPPICCGKCGQAVAEKSPGNWPVGRLYCDHPGHVGLNFGFKSDERVWGCPTIDSCNWGVCLACWEKNNPSQKNQETAAKKFFNCAGVAKDRTSTWNFNSFGIVSGEVSGTGLDTAGEFKLSGWVLTNNKVYMTKTYKPTDSETGGLVQILQGELLLDPSRLEGSWKDKKQKNSTQRSGTFSIPLENISMNELYVQNIQQSFSGKASGQIERDQDQTTLSFQSITIQNGKVSAMTSKRYLLEGTIPADGSTFELTGTYGDSETPLFADAFSCSLSEGYNVAIIEGQGKQQWIVGPSAGLIRETFKLWLELIPDSKEGHEESKASEEQKPTAPEIKLEDVLSIMNFVRTLVEIIARTPEPRSMRMLCPVLDALQAYLNQGMEVLCQHNVIVESTGIKEVIFEAVRVLLELFLNGSAGFIVTNPEPAYKMFENIFNIVLGIKDSPLRDVLNRLTEATAETGQHNSQLVPLLVKGLLKLHPSLESSSTKTFTSLKGKMQKTQLQEMLTLTFSRPALGRIVDVCDVLSQLHVTDRLHPPPTENRKHFLGLVSEMLRLVLEERQSERTDPETLRLANSAACTEAKEEQISVLNCLFEPIISQTAFGFINITSGIDNLKSEDALLPFVMNSGTTPTLRLSVSVDVLHEVQFLLTPSYAGESPSKFHVTIYTYQGMAKTQLGAHTVAVPVKEPSAEPMWTTLIPKSWFKDEHGECKGFRIAEIAAEASSQLGAQVKVNSIRAIQKTNAAGASGVDSGDINRLHPHLLKLTCTKGHRIYTSKEKTKYGCDVCKRKGLKRGPTTLVCSECNFDVCPNCVAQIQITCPGGHTLLPSEDARSYQCDVCKTSGLSRTSQTIVCRRCDFDICPTCMLMFQAFQLSVHEGVMVCKCAHQQGNVRFPLPGSRIHINGTCLWECCKQNWDTTCCTAVKKTTSAAPQQNTDESCQEAFAIFFCFRMTEELLHQVDEVRRGPASTEISDLARTIADTFQLVARVCPTFFEGQLLQQYLSRFSFHAEWKYLLIKNSHTSLSVDFYERFIDWLDQEEALVSELKVPHTITDEMRKGWQERLMGPALETALAHQGFINAFQGMLKRHIRNTDIATFESDVLSRLISTIIEMKDQSKVQKLEVWWRDCIADWVFDFIRQNASVTNNVRLKRVAKQISPDQFVRGLCEMLVRVKSLPYYMGLSNAFQMTGQAAFQVAYRRLQRELAVDVMDQVAVFLNTLLDTSRTDLAVPLQQQRMEHLEKIADLVEVFRSQEDLSYFYEFLLAERLLRARYFSLRFEKWILGLVDTARMMGRAHRMLDDMGKSVQINEDLRSYVLKERRHLQPASSEAKEALSLVLSKSFTVSLISHDAWPGKAIPKISFEPLAQYTSFVKILEEFYIQYKEKPEKSRIITFPMAGSVSLCKRPPLSQPDTPCLEIVVTPLQACILMYFNLASSYSIKELVGRTHANIEDIRSAVKSLLSPVHSILMFDKSDGCLEEDDKRLLVNASFSPKDSTVLVHRVVNEKLRDATKLAHAALWRVKVIEGAIVKAVKGKGIMPVNKVIEEVRKALQNWYSVSEGEVQRCVEALKSEKLLESHASCAEDSHQQGLSYLADGSETESTDKQSDSTLRVLESLSNTSSIVGKTLFKLLTVKFDLPAGTDKVHYEELCSGLVTLAYNRKLSFKVKGEEEKGELKAWDYLTTPIHILLGHIQSVLVDSVTKNGMALLQQAGKTVELPPLLPRPGPLEIADCSRIVATILAEKLSFVPEAFSKMLELAGKNKETMTVNDAHQVLSKLTDSITIAPALKFGVEAVNQLYCDEKMLLKELISLWSPQLGNFSSPSKPLVEIIPKSPLLAPVSEGSVAHFDFSSLLKSSEPKSDINTETCGQDNEETTAVVSNDKLDSSVEETKETAPTTISEVHNSVPTVGPGAIAESTNSVPSPAPKDESTASAEGVKLPESKGPFNFGVEGGFSFNFGGTKPAEKSRGRSTSPAKGPRSRSTSRGRTNANAEQKN